MRLGGAAGAADEGAGASVNRARLLRRIERLLALVEELESQIDTRGLEALTDEELDALYLELGGEPEPAYRVVRSRGVEGAVVVDETLPASSEPPVHEEVPEPAPVSPDSEKDKEAPRATTVRRSTDLPERNPRRGEWWRVTFRPYRPPGLRPRAVQERAFGEE